LVAALVVIGIGASAFGSYAAIANNWLPDVTGRFFSEEEHLKALEAAREEGYQDGLEVGELAGYAKGQRAGHDAGAREGRAAGFESGYNTGYRDGADDGHADGYWEGFEEGWSSGCLALFDGLRTDRVGDWWDYYYSSAYGSYYTRSACSE